MTKVLVISGTPRLHGNSNTLADQVIAGARAAGADVEKVRLADLRIDPCDACDACQSSREAPCILGDDMIGLYPKVQQADVLVLASPIYFFSASAQLKAFVDRTYALGGGGDWSALQGKRLALIFTHGDDNALFSGVANAYRMFQDACRFLGMDLVDCLHASCGDAGEVRANSAAMSAAHALGRRLASSSAC